MTPERRTLLIGLAVFLVFAFAITSWSPVAPRHLEARLQEAATEALSSREYRWAQVSVEGQVATLEGRWPSETAHDAALATLWSSEWSGGRLAGGLTRIIDNTEPQEGEAASRIVAIIGEDGLSITGVVPDDAARTELLEFADLLFPGDFEARLSARSDAEGREGWLAAASQLLSALSRLEEGVFVLETEQALLYGLADSNARAETAMATLAEIPQSYRNAVLIFTGDQHAGEITDNAWCQEFLEAAGLMGRMRFNPGSSDLQSTSNDNLVHISRVARACPETEFTVSIRPVVSGNAPAETLAEQRGQAVRAALGENGLDLESIVVRVEPQQDQLVRIFPGIEGEG
ncbi:hypothetical protein [Hyphobacterium sp.]|uniref:hypothetical protein n=1 Tax=Hyphobacterium sp. TaxID=2004662 RepID=UPI003BAC3469